MIENASENFKNYSDVRREEMAKKRRLRKSLGRTG
jgi:hypothetical protein